MPLRAVTSPIRLLFRGWSGAAIRLGLATYLLVIAVHDHPARLARMSLATLPDLDIRAFAAELRDAGRYAEAEQALLAALDDASEPDERARILADLHATVSARNSLLSKLRTFATGAVLGQSESLEGLLGAVTADLCVVGDVRDLIIQGARWATDGSADPVLVTLSAVGLITTVAPELDAAGALLKLARRADALRPGMLRALERLCGDVLRGGNPARLRAALADIDLVGRRGGPALALQVMRHADDPADIARAARYLEETPAGGFALAVTGEAGLKTITRGGHAVESVAVAARKGPAGARWLRSGAVAAFRPHPLLGLTKSIYKGNAPRLVLRALDRIDELSWAVIPGLATWIYFELVLSVRRLRQSLSPRAASPAAAQP
jgi:hypothetical protein